MSLTGLTARRADVCKYFKKEARKQSKDTKGNFKYDSRFQYIRETRNIHSKLKKDDDISKMVEFNNLKCK